MYCFIPQTLQEKTVRLLLNLQNNMQPQDWPAPFAEGSCRVELYQLLYTLSTEPHPVWPPPTQHALKILSAGMADIDSMVSAFCTKAHAAFEKVIHPPAGTLQFPVNLEEIVESTKFNKQNSAVPHDELSNASNGEDTRCVNSVKKDISSGTMDTGSTRMETSSPRIDTGCSIRIEPDSVRTISNEKDTQSKQPAQQKELRNEAKEKVSASEKQEVLYDEKVKNGNKNRVGSVSDEEMESENDVTLLSDDSDYSEKKINKKQTILNKYPCDIEDDGLDGEEEEEEKEKEEEEEEMEEEEEEEYDDEDEDVVVIGESDAEDKNVTQIKPSFKLVEKMKNGMPRQEVVQTTSTKDIEHKMTEEQVALKLVTDFSRSHNRGVKSNRTVDPLEETDMQFQQLEEDNIDKDAVQTKTREEYQTQHGLEYDEDDGDYGSDDSIVDDYDEHDTSDRGEEDEKQEPVKKRAKLDSTDSVNLISKTEVTDDTEINMEQTEQQINGVESGPEEATEEEMLQSFVDAVPE
ncbi:hypothetical protein C0J52_19620 [Blattella germanica]|nr:hypothetical protein C0J52_19620 [Blattella germanica]